MITRLVRHGAAAALGTLAVAASASTPAGTEAWRFRVLLDGKPIGHHDFVVTRDGAATRVAIDARFDVRFLRIPVYSYRHDNTETWVDGCISELASRTDDNGEELTVSARATSESLVVDTGESVERIETACVRSFAYWDRELISADRLLNAQTGELVPVSVEPVEAAPPDGRFDPARIDARRIRSADGEVDIVVAYARDTGRWLYLESTLENGRTLRYLPEDPAAALAGDPAGGSS